MSSADRDDRALLRSITEATTKLTQGLLQIAQTQEKQTTAAAGLVMFLDDRSVVQRHGPAGVLDEFAAVLHVVVVEGGLLEIGRGCHSGNGIRDRAGQDALRCTLDLDGA